MTQAGMILWCLFQVINQPISSTSSAARTALAEANEAVAREEMEGAVQSCMQGARTRAERTRCVSVNAKEQLESALGAEVDDTTVKEVTVTAYTL